MTIGNHTAARKHYWIIVAFAVVQALIIGLIGFGGGQPTASSVVLGTPTPTNTPTPTPTFTPTPTPTPTPTSTPTPTATPSPTATPTPAPATPTPTPERCRPLKPGQGGGDHYWLERPFGPDDNSVVSHFYPYGSTGNGQYLLHHGVDIQNPMDTPALAVADGTAIVAGGDSEVAYGPTTDFYGQLVVVQLDRPFGQAQGKPYGDQPVFALYGHLSEVVVEPGQPVRAGDVVGRVGMTGVAIGPHTHLEVRVGGNTYADTRNPELWLKPFPGLGAIAGRLVDADGCPISDELITVHRADAPDARWRDVRTYIMKRDVNPDDTWGEDFVLGDVPAGSYVLKTLVHSRLYTVAVDVVAGQTAFVEIEVE